MAKVARLAEASPARRPNPMTAADKRNEREKMND